MSSDIFLLNSSYYAFERENNVNLATIQGSDASRQSTGAPGNNNTHALIVLEGWRRELVLNTFGLRKIMRTTPQLIGGNHHHYYCDQYYYYKYYKYY